ncbi:hypothetical protein N7532_009660 [Penicillium argentinense]|uniref:NB-ARC domain-containing protein n=1 Tax=Penicillium argentinense TaxID=1131581 RepID=A0A9W9K366_9EURO|nr:uncharacterized protein N7532_009660 [Penicillium argentinense]KAJ5090976.1 hypothetical protein N7532_009660 [Penicillium argentinense]
MSPISKLFAPRRKPATKASIQTAATAQPSQSSIQAVLSPDDPMGLTVVWPPEYKQDDPDIVVFVHGLNGGSYRTWTDGSTFWPKDLLPTILPTARVLTFGYNANIYRDCAKGRIEEFSQTLYSDVEINRTSVQSVAIAQNKNPGASIFQVAAGVVFLATPHRGSKNARWGDIGARLCQATKLGAPRTSSAQELRLFSNTVVDINAGFVHLSNRFSIISFHEQQGYPVLGLIVEAYSAIMDVPNEIHTVALNANHVDVCRFENSVDPNFQILSRYIRSLVVDNLKVSCKAHLTSYDILAQMIRHIDDRSISHHRFGLYGQIGVGKTQIALRFLDQYAHRFPVRLWVYADTDHKIRMSFDSIARKLGFESAGTNPEQIIEFVKDWLAHHAGWVVVFDNVEDLRLVASYWPRQFPQDSFIIITSRVSGISLRSGPLTDSVKVECFSEEDATEWFWSQIDTHDRDPAEKALATEIVKKVGCLPLAVNHMAAYIEGRSHSLSEFLYEFQRDDSIAIGQYVAGANISYEEQNLAKAWELSLSGLDDKAAELLDLLSLLDPDRIPLGLLDHFDAAAQTSVSDILWNYRSQQLAISTLEYKSLLEKRKRQPTLRIHRMTQSANRNQWANEPTRQARAFMNALFCICRVYPRQEKGGSMVEFFPSCAQFTEHLLSILDFYQRHARELNPTEEFAEILAHCGWYFFERGETKSARDVLLEAEAICLQLGSGHSQTLGLIYNNLGAVCMLRREEHKGLKYTIKAIEHREHTIPKDSPEIQQLGISYMNYANDMQLVQPFDKNIAADFFNRALDIAQHSPGGTVKSQELVLSNMSCAYYRWNMLDKALHYVKQAVALHQECGADTTYMLYTLYYYGNIQWKLGARRDSYAIHHDCLRRRQILQGDEHYTTGVSLYKTGKLAYELGYQADALEYLEKAEKTFRAYHDDPGLWPRGCLMLGKVMLAIGGSKPDGDLRRQGQEFWDKGMKAARDLKGTSFQGRDDDELDSLVREVYR